MSGITIPVTDDEITQIRRARKEGGGFQSLFRALEEGLKGDQLTVSRTAAERVIRYGEDYGWGGWEQHLKPLVAKIREAIA